MFEHSGQVLWRPNSGRQNFLQELLHTNDIPTATYRQFDSLDKARSFLESREDEPVVVKADGLAAGKGVFVCNNRKKLLMQSTNCNAIHNFARQHLVLIEERLDGVEVSVIAKPMAAPS